jgi:hypothetical protein
MGAPPAPQTPLALPPSPRPEAPLLRKADAARKARARWRAAAIAGGIALVPVLLFFVALFIVFGFPTLLVLFALLCTLPLAAFLAYAASRAAARGREIAPALDAAWLAVATDVARQVRGITAPALALKLGIAEAQAEELLALVDVERAVRRVRIDPDDRSSDLASEEEAALAEQIEAKARALEGRDGKVP